MACGYVLTIEDYHIRLEIHLWWELESTLICWIAHRCSLWRPIQWHAVGEAPPFSVSHMGPVLGVAGHLACSMSGWFIMCLWMFWWVLKGQLFSASFLQSDGAQDVLQGIHGVVHCGHSQDSLWKPNESFRGITDVQHGQNQKVLCCCYIQICIQHSPTVSAVSMPCNIPLKLLRLALLSIWEKQHK